MTGLDFFMLSITRTVENVFLQAGDSVKAIEKATWSGTNDYDRYGNNPYDGLMDKIARTGGVVLKLPKVNILVPMT
ncbi:MULTISPECIES: hypothetical protein [unclassified Pseudomonas]|uniref:hypothetical protein n=1 Tax=unclassified Pseudomonas TaxID=196821 RepID=UPI00215CE684|nr:MULTISPECIES: hypothetical protein [unclassified Pseudomonas]MCR8934582.1 hypothetical protein [Pseudomonas sp. S11A4]MCR8972838.1 hypothetical protein [Pseudomonas sp. S11P7]